MRTLWRKYFQRRRRYEALHLLSLLGGVSGADRAQPERALLRVRADPPAEEGAERVRISGRQPAGPRAVAWHGRDGADPVARHPRIPGRGLSRAAAAAIRPARASA